MQMDKSDFAILHLKRVDVARIIGSISFEIGIDGSTFQTPEKKDLNVDTSMVSYQVLESPDHVGQS